MQHYSTDIPQTATELFDGELVIANYGSGLYYSVSTAGALVWQALKGGFSDERVVRWLRDVFPGESESIEAGVPAFIDRMAQEGLLLPIPASPVAATTPVTSLTTLGAFELERFEDLQDLLLLDPVHDVAETGWPHRADSAD